MFTDQSALQPGQQFAGRYRVVRCMAAGGMGAVYEVLDTETERRRALKVMLPDLLANDDMRSRFQREARVTAKIQSEHLVDVFDVGVDPATSLPFFVMEFLVGEELGLAVQKRGPLAPSDALLYLKQVASALDKTHEAGIVHRDLKPENLFLTRRDDGSPRIKILDFGISKVIRDGSANISQTLGTPMYMAPEQLSGQPVGPATDIYALGHIAYTLLVGHPYWLHDANESDNLFAFIRIAATGPTDQASVRAARTGYNVSSEFDAWFQRIANVDPRERFTSASAAIDALGTCLHGIAPQSVRLVGPANRGPDDGARVISSGSNLLRVDASSQRDEPAAAETMVQFERSAKRTASSRGALLGLGAVSLLAVCVGLALSLRSTRPSPQAASSTIASAVVQSSLHPSAQAAPAALPPQSAEAPSAPSNASPEPQHASSASASVLAAPRGPVSASKPGTVPTPKPRTPQKPPVKLSHPKSLYTRD